MFRSQRGFGIVSAVLVCLAAVGCTHARPPRVKDGGGLFKPDTVASANEIIRGIKHQYNIDVVVETLKAPPRRYGRPHNATIRVLAYREKEPARVHVEIDLGPDRLVQKPFPEEARRELRDRLRAHFEQKDYDHALLDGLGFIEDTVHANLGVPLDWTTALGLVLPLLAAWLVLEAVRLVIRDRVPAGATTISQDNGGGSVLPGLFAMLVNHDLAKVAWNGGTGRTPLPSPCGRGLGGEGRGAAGRLPDADPAAECHGVAETGDEYHAHPAQEMMRHDE